jgi:ribosomal protein S18 acetylase RimI-like enzyme
MKVRPLARGEEGRAQELLRGEPVRNIILSSLLSEHGLSDPRSRGKFYGCFREGRLAGVALVGWHTLLACGEEEASAFGQAARRAHAEELNLLLAGPREAEAFRESFYSQGGACARRPPAESNLMLSLSAADSAALDRYDADVRPALPSEAGEVARLHSQGSLALYGSDPAEADPVGYGERVRERVGGRRVWVICDGRGIAFKTDLAAQYGGVVYLEGVLTRPDLLGAGTGTRAFGSLCRKLLRGYDTLCLLVAEENTRALDFYRRIGFRTHSRHSLLRWRRPAAARTHAPPAHASAAAEHAVFV